MSYWHRIRIWLHNSFRPRGADKVVRILHGLAMIDDELDERELAFIHTFAKRWRFDLDDTLLSGDPSHPVEASSFTYLRGAMGDYLALSPRVDQAHQLRDVLTSLSTIDGKICDREELMLEELGRMIDRYVGGSQTAGYAVFLAPQSAAQSAAINDTMPGLEKTQLHGAAAFQVGTYHSDAYAQLVSSWYREAGYQTTVERSG